MIKQNYRIDSPAMDIHGFWNTWKDTAGMMSRFLTLNNSSWKISKRLRLTVTQGHQLAKLAAKYKLRTGKPLPDFLILLLMR